MVNRATISLFLLIILLKFISENDSGFLRYISAKFFIALIIITEILVLPQHAYTEDASDISSRMTNPRNNSIKQFLKTHFTDNF